MWLYRPYDRETLQNNVVPRTGQVDLKKVQEAAVYNFLSQKGRCTAGHSTSEAWKKLLFFEQFLSYVPFICLWGPAHHNIHCSRHSAIPWSCDSTGLSLSCRYKDSLIQNTQSGTFQHYSDLETCQSVLTCYKLYSLSYTASVRQTQKALIAGLPAPGWKQKVGCWSLFTLCNHLLSQQANLFCQR